MSATDTRAVVQQMIAWMRSVVPGTDEGAHYLGAAIEAGRALLAALPEQPAAEPVAWLDSFGEAYRRREDAWDGDPESTPPRPVYAAPQGDSVVWCGCGDGITPNSGAICGNCAALGAVSVPAETASGANGQDQPKRPLTRHELHLALDFAGIAGDCTFDKEIAIARVVERAHGITGGSSNE